MLIAHCKTLDASALQPIKLHYLNEVESAVKIGRHVKNKLMFADFSSTILV